MHDLFSAVMGSAWSVPYASYLFTAVTIFAFGFVAVVVIAPVFWRIAG